MLPLARNGYTAAQVANALNAVNGVRTLSYRYDLLSGTNTLIKPLTGTISGSVAFDSTNTIQRTGKFRMLDDPSIDWLSNRVKPYVRVLMPDGGYAEFPCGVFLLSTPEQISEPTGAYIYRDVAGYDQIQVLTDNKTTDRYAVASGTIYTTAVQTLLTTAGFTTAQMNITPTAKTLPVVQEWPGGTPLLTIINTLLAAVGYDSLWFNADGLAQVSPHVLPTARPSDWTYSADSSSVILPGMKRSYDLFAIPNVFVLVVSDPSRPTPLRSVYTNANPLSPTSTVRRLRSITSYDATQQAPDQTTLDALAKTAAFNASQVYETVAFSTIIMPMHEHLDVITVNQGSLGVSALYAETAWSFNLAVGAQMTHSIKRIIPV